MDTVTPMSPKLQEFKNKSDDEYIYQIKWDGVRILTYKAKGDIKLINKNMKDKTKQFPELHSLISLKSDFIIDGEAMIIKDNKNSFSKILKRNMTTDKRKIDYYSQEIPITYAVFDILYLDGKWLLNEPIEKRQEMLSNLLSDNSIIHICQNYDNGVDLFNTTKELELEGVIAKKKSSKYIPGKKSNEWVKYKHKREIKPKIGGILVESQTVKSLAVGIHEGDNFIYIGNVGTGLSTVDKKNILQKTVDKVILESPFINFGDKKHIWIEPTVECYIEFMEWTDDITLRSPVFKGIMEV